MNRSMKNLSNISCITTLMKYIRKGEGEYEATQTDKVMGLTKVAIAWFRTGLIGEVDLKKHDNTGDDRTSSTLLVSLYHENGEIDKLLFEVDFAGYHSS